MGYSPLAHKESDTTEQLSSSSSNRGIAFAFLKKNNFIYLFLLYWVFVAVRAFSLVVASGGYCSLQVCWLLVAVASLVAEHRP